MNKNKWTVWLVLALLLLVIVILVPSVKTREVMITWDRYDVGSNPDIAYLSIYEVTSDTVSLKKLRDVSWEDTVATVAVVVEDKIYYFSMTATDTCGNECGFSNVAVLDGKSPEKVRGVGARWK